MKTTGPIHLSYHKNLAPNDRPASPSRWNLRNTKFLSRSTRCLSVAINKQYCVRVSERAGGGEREYISAPVQELCSRLQIDALRRPQFNSSNLKLLNCLRIYWTITFCATRLKMDLRIIFPVLSMLSSGFFDFAAPASLGHDGTETDTSISARHSRTKRCSCASFLDKECVYFCHLDIIWVNTPERTVSYGLGNAPRKKRSVTEPVVPKSRCKCADSKDKTCSTFCQPNNALRYKDEAIHAALGHDCAEKQCKHKLADKQTKIRRVKNTDVNGDVLSRVRAVKNIHLLLEKWRARQHHRPRARMSGNAAS